MTDRHDTDRPEANSERQTLGEMSHTNPHTDQPFGDVCAFQRGPTVAADGGRAEADDEERETMGDVAHEHPHDGETPNRVFERGLEGRDETV